nr:hypothetical protein Itr_chr14CG22380 [Ipomoea trifida]
MYLYLCMFKYIGFIHLSPLTLFEMISTWSLLTTLYILYFYIYYVISFNTWIMFQIFLGRSVSGKPSRF